MSISDKPWGSISASDYKDAAAYCDACLIDANEPGKPKTKDACKLPYKEPGGAVNRNGVHAAVAVLAGARGGVQASSADKRKAARKLASLYAEMKETLPDSVKRMAQ